MREVGGGVGRGGDKEEGEKGREAERVKGESSVHYGSSTFQRRQ